MRVLLISDIHSNWVALSAIQEQFDLCLCLGDLVDYGLAPVPVVDWVMTHAQVTVRGNHDHAVAQRVPARPGSGFRELACLTRPQHWELLQNRQLKYLSRLPLTSTLEIDGLRYYLVHASPRDPLDEYVLDGEAGWRQRVEGIEADLICVGHTHVQSLLDLGSMRVLNPGSVGQPRDLDPRAAYAIIDNGKIELRRVEYDIEAALQQMEQAGANPRALQIAREALTSGGVLTSPRGLNNGETP